MAGITATTALAVLLAAAGVQSAVGAGCCSWGTGGECGPKCGGDAEGNPADCAAIEAGTEACSTYCNEGQEQCERDCGGTYIPDGVPFDNCGEANPFTECHGYSQPGESCADTRCCANLGETCYEKDAYWSACRPACEPGAIDPNDPPEYQTPWTCTELGPMNTTVEGRDCYEVKQAYNVRSCCEDANYLGMPMCRRLKRASKVAGCCMR